MQLLRVTPLAPEVRARIVLICIVILFIICTILRLIIYLYSPENDSNRSFECMNKALKPWEEVAGPQFIEHVQYQLDGIVKHCVEKRLQFRLQRIGDEQSEILFAIPLVQDQSHRCSAIFIGESNVNNLDNIFKDKHPECMVYSVGYIVNNQSSANVVHHNFQLTGVYSKNTVKTNKIDNILNYIFNYVRRFTIDTANVISYSNHTNSMKIMSDMVHKWGPLYDYHVDICQLNFVIRTPEKENERQLLKALLFSILKESRYLLTSYSNDWKGKNLRFFFMHTKNKFCWAKYLNPSLPYATN